MINPDSVTALLESAGLPWEQVDNQLIKFRRAKAGLDYAICYVDLSGDLPRSEVELTKYQDENLGPRYFAEVGPMKWNQYLYFIATSKEVEDPEGRAAIQRIEADRSFARKFVLTPERLESLLEPAIPDPIDGPLSTSITTNWQEIWESYGFDWSIFSVRGLDNRVSLIEKNAPSVPRSALARPERTPLSDAENPPIVSTQYLRRIQLHDFRSFDSKTDFHFGDVNLIRGPNGAGKTSLLEAIETYYCGKTSRNPNASERYRLGVTHERGIRFVVDQSRKPEIFRERNLTWYGQREHTSWNAQRGFSVFNFFDADAPFELGSNKQSSDQLQDALTSLLIGERTSSLWSEIVRMREAILSRINRLKLELEENAEESRRLKEFIASAGSESVADGLAEELREAAERLGWKISDDTALQGAVRMLPEQISLLEQAASVGLGIDGSISIEEMTGVVERQLSILEKCRAKMREIERLEREFSNATNEVRRFEDLQHVAHVIAQFFLLDDGGWSPSATNFETRLEEVSVLTAPFDELDLDLDAFPYEGSIAGARSHIENAVSELGGVIASLKLEQRRAREMDGESRRLLSEIRSLSLTWISSTQDVEACPVCETRFDDASLRAKLSQTHSGDVGPLEATASVEIAKHESHLAGLLRDQVAIERLGEFARLTGTDSDSIADTIGRVDRMLSLRQQLTKALTMQRQLSDLTRLDESTFASLDSMLAAVSKGLDEVALPTSETIEKKQLALRAGMQVAVLRASTKKREIGDSRLELAMSLGTSDGDQKSFEIALVSRQNEASIAARISDRLRSDTGRFPFESTKPISELAVDAKSIHDLSVRTLEARVDEANHAAEALRSNQQLISYEADAAELDRKTENLERARDALSEIDSSSSPERFLEESLNDQRASVEAIFRMIHSPKQFDGLADSWTTLRRIDGDKVVSLAEVSTGQRAALALAIFLSQNSRLRNGPPILLIDDPVAHVDDLNSLSFIDYVREIAVQGRRQIFVASADSKFSELFERKHAFLGPSRFRSFHLEAS